MPTKMKTLTSLGVRKTAEIPASASETICYVHILDYSLLYIYEMLRASSPLKIGLTTPIRDDSQCILS